MLKLVCRNEGYRFYIDNIRYGSSDTMSAVDDIPDERENLSFPAQMLAFTDEEVEAQRRAGEKLYEDIEAAIERGDDELVVPDGYYRFGRGKYANLKIEGAENLKIVGNDVNIIEEIVEKAVEVVNCTNLTLQGLSLIHICLSMICKEGIDAIRVPLDPYMGKTLNGKKGNYICAMSRN